VGRRKGGRDGLIFFVVCVCVCVCFRGGGSRSVRREMRRWWLVVGVEEMIGINYEIL